MYREDNLHPGFTKHVLDLPLKDGTIARVAVHHMTEPETPEADAHDHPFNLISTVLYGGYVEEIYHKQEDNSWMKEVVHRKVGDTFSIPAETIHKVVQLPKEESITAVIQGEPYREWRHYNVNNE